MASTAAADLARPSLEQQQQDASIPDQNPDVSAANNGTSAAEGDNEKQNQHTHKDDPATMAASEELKHTSISGKPSTTDPNENQGAQAEILTLNNTTEPAIKLATPERTPSVHDEEMTERISSPKKKRGRNQDEDSKDEEGEDSKEDGSSADGSALNGNRTMRSEPEKKRHRDTSQEPSIIAGKTKDVNKISTELRKKSKDDTPENIKDQSNISGSEGESKPTTSASAFANSGFASLAASSTSPFGTLGATKPSVFRGDSSTTTGFGALTATDPHKPTTFDTSTGEKASLRFGSGFGNATSGFGALAGGSAFGAGLGNGFAGSGTKLTSFAAPGKENNQLETKPAKAFGAPDSDEEGDGSDADNSSEGDADADEEESVKGLPEDKKKSKLTKVQVEDGEAGEITLLQLRAKLFGLTPSGWKERGMGTLKLNVHKDSVETSEYDQPIPETFGPSAISDDDTAPLARLIMRQENTHKVILNTIILKALEFKDKHAAQGAQISFTAIEGDTEPKPVQMVLKMSEANAKLFHSQIKMIKHGLP